MKKLIVAAVLFAAGAMMAQESAPAPEGACKCGAECKCETPCKCDVPKCAEACAKKCECKGECKCAPKGPDCGCRRPPKGPRGERPGAEGRPQHRRPRLEKCNCCPECKGYILPEPPKDGEGRRGRHPGMKDKGRRGPHRMGPPPSADEGEMPPPPPPEAPVQEIE